MDPVTRKRLLWLGVGVLAFGLSQTESPPIGHLEARVAQALLNRSWSEPPQAEANCAGRAGCPVARISIPGQRAVRIVLRQSGDLAPTGGWGHLAGTPLPDAPGNTVFRIYAPEDGVLLRQLRRGDTIVVELPDARQFVYRVSEARVTERRAVRVDDDTRGTDLTLISRQADDARADLRIVVHARLQPAPLVASAGPAALPIERRPRTASPA